MHAISIERGSINESRNRAVKPFMRIFVFLMILLIAGCRSVPEPPETTSSGILTAPLRQWSEIRFRCSNGTFYLLSPGDAERTHYLLATMKAEATLTTLSHESEQPEPGQSFMVLIQYNDYPHAETIHSAKGGRYFFRYTDTAGEHGQGGLGGLNDDLYALLSNLVVQVRVFYAEEGILNKFVYVEKFVDAESDREIIIATNEILRNFSFREVSVSEDSPFLRAGNVLHYADALLPEKPLIVTWLGRDLPHRGISFVDKHGTARYFSINTSGYDGSLFLLELRPAIRPK